VKERWTYLGLAALLTLLWLATLQSRPLFNPDEGRYAEIPREMLNGGDWIVPHLNGLAYIEKPPLQYWATAVSYKLFGPSEFAARVYTALTALGTIALVWLAAGRFWGSEVAWRAAAVLPGMLLFLALGQLLTLDMSLTFYTTLSLVGFLLAQGESRPRSWMLLAWAAAALGVLTKGLVAAAIPAAVLILYSLCSRDFSPWRRLCAAWGVPLFLVITVPWHWAAAEKTSDFLQFFFVREHFARYLTPVSDRQQPWWFFGAIFLAGTVPWTVSAVRVLLGQWRRGAGTFQVRLFLWIWVVFIIVFFSLSDSKLMPYILPAMPALALLIGGLPRETLQRDFQITALVTIVAGAALGVASFNWPRILAASARAVYFLPLARPLAQIALLLVVSGAFVFVKCSRDATRAGVFLGVGWCLAWLLLMRAASVTAPIYSGVGLAAAVPVTDQDAPFYTVGTYDQSLTFYLGRPVTLVAYRGELDYGLQRSPAAEIGDIADFVRLWNSDKRAFAVMEKKMCEDLKQRGVPMRVLADTVNLVLVTRR
jgi:4-amino-4-deoxy-L-arabinose transferase-like glycosyltransferase